MVVLYVAGQRVGTLADAETLIPEFAAKKQTVEFRDEAGNPLGTFTSARYAPPFGNDPAFREFLDACAEARADRNRTSPNEMPG